jgi:uncharacterized OB-fold protein
MRFDLPSPDATTQPFWDACVERRLLFSRCSDCGLAFYYPRPFCKRCWSDNVGWEAASGRGTLYTYSVVHVNDLPPFPQRVPYVAAMVQLAEGPRVMTNIVDCDVDDLCCGLALEVDFREICHDPRVVIPVFRPALR